MDYVVGDLQGCGDALERLLIEIGFSPSRDHLYAVGDLVNRGPQSLATLQRLVGLGAAATCLLGNHDLHLMAVAEGIRPAHRSDTLDDILQHPRRAEWLDWLRHRPLAHRAHGWLMVHAGLVPRWSADDALARADEVHRMLRGPDLHGFLAVMYGNQPDRWSDALTGHDRWRFIINVFTRIRFCTPDGQLDFQAKAGLDTGPAGYLPWFQIPGRRSAATPVAFGHWSTVGLINQPHLLSLDTGCVWGGALTAVRIDGGRREVVQVNCAKVQARVRAPGAA